MIPPTEKEHWPRLSTSLPHPRHPFTCQACGIMSDHLFNDIAEPETSGFRRWQEHDQQDKPQGIYVVLCKKCSEMIIEPHERLYRCLSMWEPAPGAMTVCVDCIFRQGLHCSHPNLKENGGEGLNLKFPRPSTGFIDSRKGGYSGPAIFYCGRVNCTERNTEGAPAEETSPIGDKCRSCQAPIVWLKTKADKTMPVNAESIWPGDDEYDPERHTSHFATCPQAASWKKKKAKTA